MRRGSCLSPSPLLSPSPCEEWHLCSDSFLFVCRVSTWANPSVWGLRLGANMWAGISTSKVSYGTGGGAAIRVQKNWVTHARIGLVCVYLEMGKWSHNLWDIKGPYKEDGKLNSFKQCAGARRTCIKKVAVHCSPTLMKVLCCALLPVC